VINPTLDEMRHKARLVVAGTRMPCRDGEMEAKGSSRRYPAGAVLFGHRPIKAGAQSDLELAETAANEPLDVKRS